MVFKFDRYTKSLGLLGAGALVSVLFGIMAWLWVKEAKNDFLKKNEDLINLSSKKTNLVYMKRAQENITVNKDRILKSFVPEEKIVDFIVFLENIARDTGNFIDIGSVSSQEESQTGLFNFKVTLTGTYPEFVNFIDRLDNSSYLARTKKVDIFETTDPQTKTSLFKASLELEVLGI